MNRYQILIEYVGTNFRGWQIQKKGSTIQGLIQEKLSKLLKEKIVLHGQGRTDAGVHAFEQSAHFDCKNKIEFKFSSQSFLQHQVRSMVGCLKYLGENKWDLKTFEKRFKLKKRTLCAPPAPPGGLFLFRVLY